MDVRAVSVDFNLAAIYLGCGQALSCSRRAVTGVLLGEKELQEMNRRREIASQSTGPTIVAGEILVEIMATERGLGFLEPLTLIGPYPSGAPAIFIDQVGKLGHAAGIVAAVGDDDFGTLNRGTEHGRDVG